MIKKRLLKAIAIATITTNLMACSDSNNKSSSTSNNEKSEYRIINNKKTTDTNNDNVKLKASYTIGYGMGSSINQDPNIKDYGLYKDQVISGFEDAMYSKKSEIPQQDIKTNIDSLRKTMMHKINEKRINSFLKIRDIIYNSDLNPKLDVKNPNVVIYEFFDYQCIYCAKLAPQIEIIIKNNSDVQVLFSEFPIFSQRYPASKYAAEVGTAIYKLYGDNTYVKYHNGIFAIGEDEGNLNNATINKIAKQVGANIDDIEKAIKDYKISSHVNNTLEIDLKDINIQGTPLLIIAPIKDANTNNTTIIGGYTNAANIQKAVDNAKL